MQTIIIKYVVAIVIVTIIRWILSKFDKFVDFLINKSVHWFEKLIKGSKMGSKRKKWVLRFLRIFGIKSTKAVSALIDTAVDMMNTKRSDLSDSFKEDMSDNIESKIEKTGKQISNKISRKDIKNK